MEETRSAVISRVVNGPDARRQFAAGRPPFGVARAARELPFVLVGQTALCSPQSY